MASKEYFPQVSKVEYKGEESTDPLSFRWYNADEVIMGKTMAEWCRFTMCFWHTWRFKGLDPFGGPTMTRAFDDESDTLDNAYRRIDAGFELMQKCQIKFYSFHDLDISPPGKTLQETEDNLDKVTDYLLVKQKETGIGLLWATQNMFSHRRYMHGAATSPDADVFAYACAAAKKTVDVTLKLGGANIVFWGGREGYQSLLNTDVKRELDHLGAYMRMVRDYKNKVGCTAQLLIEPKPREPTKHQYDYDAQTTIGFLLANGLEKDFKLNIEPNHTTLAGHEHEHDVLVASKLGFLGSIDCNTGDPLLGWDTDQFNSDVKKTTAIMKVVLEQGGLAPGGLMFDCKVRRESTADEDLFIGHVAGMDDFARGLRAAARILEEGVMPGMVKARYASFDEGFGKTVEDGTATLESGAAHAHSLKEDPVPASGQQELYERILNRYV